MSTEIIQAQYEQLDQIAARFGEQAESISKMLARITRASKALEQGDWKGKGLTSFTTEMDSACIPAIKRLIDALQQAQRTTLDIRHFIAQEELEAAAPFRNGQSTSIGAETDAFVGANAGSNGSNSTSISDDSDSVWDQFWGSWPGQQGLLALNAVWGFIAGSGHEIGKSYGPGAKVGSIAGDVGSSFLVWGDVRDLFVETYNAIHPNRDASEITAILSGAGLIGDLGWLDGPIPDPLDGVNAGAAVLKTVVKQLDELPKPVREGMEGLIKWGVKNPSRLSEIADVAQWTLKNHDTPVGQGITEMLAKAAKDPDWFDKTSDLGQWLKKDPERLANLSADAADAGKIDAKSLREANAGLSLESSGKLAPPITRDTTPAAEFIDANGQAWDVKTFNSKFPDSFKLDREVSKIGDELRLGENVILDTTDLGANEIRQLREAVESQGWTDLILWFP